MKLCVDVSYSDSVGVVAGLVFDGWTSETPVAEYLAPISEVGDYVPGKFYQRELPGVLELLKRVQEPLTEIVIDGFVWLENEQSPGLGAHLYQALPQGIPVIGVAKNPFRSSQVAVEVCRGESRRPLYVTAVGMDVQEAAEAVRTMHGDFRIPTLLKQVDQLCREALPAWPFLQ